MVSFLDSWGGGGEGGEEISEKRTAESCCRKDLEDNALHSSPYRFNWACTTDAPSASTQYASLSPAWFLYFYRHSSATVRKKGGAEGGIQRVVV